jgi:hypothetical protein
MHLSVRVIDVSHVFVCVSYRCWSCICVLRVSMLVMYLCVRGMDVGHLYVLNGCR